MSFRTGTDEEADGGIYVVALPSRSRFKDGLVMEKNLALGGHKSGIWGTLDQLGYRCCLEWLPDGNGILG